MRKSLMIVVSAIIFLKSTCQCTGSADAQDMCGSPTTAPGDSTSAVVLNIGAFYFYPTAFSPSCVGTVVAYEFCYSYTRTSGTRDDVVSIVVLESVGVNYRVVWTGCEREDRTCVTDTVSGRARCCGRTDLPADELFTVSTNHAYGFVLPASTQNVLLALENDVPGHLLSAPNLLNNPDNLPAVDSTLTPVDLGISGMQLQNIQQSSVQFIIQPPSLDPSPTPPDPSPTPTSSSISPTTTSSSEGSGGDGSVTEDGTSIVPTVVPATVGAILLIGIPVAILVLFARHKKQKSFAISQQQQTVVPENEEQFDVARNDAYTAAMATEWNEAYMTNTDSIPVARNEAYGVEGESTLNREDTTGREYSEVNQPFYDELSEQHVQQEDNIEHSYEYV